MFKQVQIFSITEKENSPVFFIFIRTVYETPDLFESSLSEMLWYAKNPNKGLILIIYPLPVSAVFGLSELNQITRLALQNTT